MAYRNGTYVAFDGLGQTDPSLSDQKYYRTIEMWDTNRSIEFSFVNSHEKTYSVLDSSRRSTLETRIQERLRNSKNVLLILSPQTRKAGSMLSYEIEQAVETYNLPLLIAYTDYRIIANPEKLSHRWPNALVERINNRKAVTLHFPFCKEAIFNSISNFSVHNLNGLDNGYNYYVESVQREWGLFKYPWDTFTNTQRD